MNSRVRSYSAFKVAEQVENLSLQRDVERGDRLVADEHRGFVTSARAMFARCFCPPLIWCG